MKFASSSGGRGGGSQRGALERRTDASAVLMNQGNALRAAGRLAEAFEQYRRAAGLQPGLPGPYEAMGSTAEQAGDFLLALRNYEQVLALQPNSRIFLRRANCLACLDRTPEAIEGYRSAIRRDPAHIDAHANLAVVLESSGNFAEALAAADQALRLSPNHMGALLSRAIVLNRLGRSAEALEATRMAEAGGAPAPEMLYQRARALTAMGDLQGAHLCVDRVLAIEPKHFGARFDRASALVRDGKVRDALAQFQLLGNERPHDAQTRLRWGLACLASGDFPSARSMIEKALAIEPTLPLARFNLGVLDLLEGDFARGLQGFESRWEDPMLGAHRQRFSGTAWLGDGDISSQRLLVYAEQGLGDSLQFCRYLPMLVDRVRSLAFEVQGPLLSLMRRVLPAQIDVVAQGETPTHFERHCPLLSLPLVFQTRLQNMPAAVPYIAADAERIATWRQRLERPGAPGVAGTQVAGGDPCGLRIGICWSGNPQHAGDHYRSLPLKIFASMLERRRLLAHGGATPQFEVLQKDIGPEDHETLAAMPHIRLWDSAIKDFDDTAALIAHCDLVISVDTAVAHLAGAMNKPVWLLLPFVPDWRWLLDRTESPWYPSARLFRQKELGDWDGVVRAVEAALADWPQSGAAVTIAVATTASEADELAVAQMFDEALRVHQAGRFADAETLYRRVLVQRQRHFETLHMLGVCLHQRGDFDGAQSAIRAALDLRPDVAAAHINYGNTMRELMRLDDALASYRRAASLDPNLAVAHYNLGTLQEQLGDHDAARAHYERALACRSSAPALVGRANCLAALGRSEEALAGYRAALELDPECVDGYANLGALLIQMEQYEEALVCIEKALKRDPGHGDAGLNGAIALNRLGHPESALRAIDRWLAAGGAASADMLRQRAQALLAMRAPDAALDTLTRAYALEPGNWGVRFELAAMMSRRLEMSAAAMAHFDALNEQRPGDPRLRFNRGIALYIRGEFKGARAELEAALAADPGIPVGDHNLAIFDLLEGNFRSGWRRHEGRWQDPVLRTQRRLFRQPVWLGEDSIAGQRLLVHAEQGLGDTLQFCRYLPLLVDRCAGLVFELPATLYSLLRRSIPASVAMVIQGTPLPAFDRHCPLLSLPLAFDTTLETIPGTVPYVAADPEHVDRWRHRVVRHEEEKSRMIRVGLAWSGSPGHSNDRQRSIALEHLMPMLHRAGAPAPRDFEFLALQNHLPERDRDALAASPRLKYFGSAIEDFEDTAALVALCDLVITVDTASAHLAGAMGKPVWILLPFVPDWRWMLDRSDSPWYPGARLFRQDRLGAWDGVINALESALTTWADGGFARGIPNADARAQMPL